jgi:tetratricopeptide (TPR) repeat protein
LVRTKQVLAADDSLPYVRLIHRGLEDVSDVSNLIAEARERFPGNPQLIWIEGRALMSSGRYELAIPLFETLVQSGQHQTFDHTSAYDSRIFGVFAYDSLATCCFRLRRYEEGRLYYQRAAEAAPGRLDYIAKQELCANLARVGGGK